MVPKAERKWDARQDENGQSNCEDIAIGLRCNSLLRLDRDVIGYPASCVFHGIWTGFITIVGCEIC